MNITLTSAILGAVALATAAHLTAQAPASPVQVGGNAPAFTLPDTQGKNHRLADFRGKYVVLEWTNADCPFVKKHYVNGDMQKTQAWAKDKGVVWLTVLSSAPGQQGHLEAAAANDLMKKHGFKAAAKLLDPAGTVGKSFGARTTPHMFVINPEGKIIYMGAIDDKRSTDPADIAGARNHVRAALEEAMAGKAVSVPSTQPYGCSVKYAN